MAGPRWRRSDFYFSSGGWYDENIIMRTLVRETPRKEGQEAEFCGWVDTRRDHGKIVFIDLRDRSGTVQVVFAGKVAGDDFSSLRSEDVVKISGLIKKRPDSMVNEKLPNRLGYYEIEAKNLTVLNRAETPAIPVGGDGYDIGEEARMKFRYLDLRRERLQKNIRRRHKIIQFIREYLDKEEFTEIETPILTKSTPEGARDYLVPARLYPGSFYALPQSPQQYKQLLMAAGMERYFQIARCFRDEDTRGDRQPEFTQMDLEMSFGDRDEVMRLNEALLIALVKKIYPEKKILAEPFPVLSHAEAMEKYGTDRPDLRKNPPPAGGDKNELAFCWVVDFPFFAKDNKGGWTFTHNPFSAPKPEYMEALMKKERVGEILTSQYDVVLNGWEIGGGSIRNHRPEALTKVFEIMGFAKERIQNNFGHMVAALGSGAPPHGGIAWGLDRLVMILENEPNIREVIAFPKTGDGRDLMMQAPSAIDEEQWRELGLKINKK